MDVLFFLVSDDDRVMGTIGGLIFWDGAEDPALCIEVRDAQDGLWGCFLFVAPA